ncbi:MerR family transcriptional regulator [Pseudogemmobacter humi]|uniref:HTH-type transcriptional regulator ZntR n=1 Tax=Pseudogemmobacter humi TaxID=2483812 RepID=A0A3P5XMW9_9RHOB|nr:MerR family DNA-binding transcriptional regulator [Pseudogemmobacter humi]VDC30030.1 HTH-type transcriptional regulator ZntR [Pseudogemmobacter humi]
MNASDLMTIREMCDAFDVTPRTLRFYEAKELIRPERQGSRRLYSRRDRARLKLILRGKRFGFSLEDIRQMLNLYAREGSNLAQMQSTYDLARERLRLMEDQRDELEIAIAELKAELDAGAMMIAAARAAD